jgi:hypothetical protein
VIRSSGQGYPVHVRAVARAVAVTSAVSSDDVGGPAVILKTTCRDYFFL